MLNLKKKMASDDDLRSEIEYHYDDEDMYNKVIDSFFVDPKKRYIIDESENKEEYEKINKQLEKLANEACDLWLEINGEEKVIEKKKEISKLLDKGADCNYLFKDPFKAENIILKLFRSGDLLSFFIQNGLDLNVMIKIFESEVLTTILHYFIDLILKFGRADVPRNLKIFKTMIEGGASPNIRIGTKNKTVMEILRENPKIGNIYISLIQQYENVFSLRLRILIEIVKGNLTIPANYPKPLLTVDREILIRNLKKYKKKIEDKY